MSYSVESLESQLEVARSRDDFEAVARLQWALAQRDIQNDELPMAFSRLMESYEINKQMGRIDGMCAAGLLAGQFMFGGGKLQRAREILTEVKEGFRKLGQPRGQQQAEMFLAKIDAAESALN